MEKWPFLAHENWKKSINTRESYINLYGISSLQNQFEFVAVNKKKTLDPVIIQALSVDIVWSDC